MIGQNTRGLQLLGRADLLACQTESAIANYKLALLLEPNSPVQLELGVAFALAGDSDPDLEREGALDYESALETMLQAGKESDGPEYLFDSALLFQRMELLHQGREQWQKAVRSEPSTKWREEEVTLLLNLDHFMQERQQRISALTRSPDSFLADKQDAHAGAELALEVAIEDWLPHLDASLSSRKAIRELGQILWGDHHDRWLLDVAKTWQSHKLEDAFGDLSAAITSNIKGEHMKAAASAVAAEKAFRESGNSAGALRAQLELAYSFDRRSQSVQCLEALEEIRQEAPRRHYIWIEGQAWLEYNACQTRTRQVEAIEPGMKAYHWITSTHYEGLGLRALGFTTEEYVSADSRLSLWRRGEQGLRLFYERPLRCLRGYSFYFTLALSAHNARNREAARVLLREGTLLMKEPGPTAIRALLLSWLGAWELEAGHEQTSTATFTEMDEVYRNLEADETLGFRQESEVKRAEAMVTAGHPQDALLRLRLLTKGTAWPYRELIGTVRRPLLHALGGANLRLNDLQKACENYLQAINENQQNMTKVEYRAQRDNALREIEPAWRGLTEVNLRLQRPSQALTVWEEFRSWRATTIVPGLTTPPECGKKSLPDSLHAPRGMTILVYAFLPGGLSGWIVNENGIDQAWIDEQQVRAAVPRFIDLIATRDSPQNDVSKSAQKVFQLLFGPFAQRLPQTGTIVIDAEDVLAGVPWNAVEDRPGHPLVERFAFSQSVGMAEAFTALPNAYLDLSRGLIFASPALKGEVASQYPYPPDAAREGERLHTLLPGSQLFEGEDATEDVFRAHAAEATFFHFAGHGVSFGGFGALLLAPSAGSSDPYLTADEIAGLDLHKLQLVVLAACSSGVGERAGTVDLDSLTRAFLEAGVLRVIAANRDVESTATETLMSSFYVRLKAGGRPAEALRLAALSVRSDPATSHPFYWAGFMVYGTP